MSSSERRFSLTLSEDDLRPHMRKPKPKPEDPRRNPMSKPILESEIEALRLKFEKREEVKKEVKRRVEEEEKDRERKRKEEEMRKITEDLWRRSQQDDRKDQKDLPRLGRRFNDSQYFKWDSVDEIPAIPEESVPRPSSRREFSPIPASSSATCELCTLARRAIDKSGALVVPTRSAACAHVDAFVAHHQSNHF